MRFLLGVLMLMISGSALATIDVLQFKDEAQEQQFRQLTEELRCPKCQNNSIADSNSMIATDLRQKVYELMQERSEEHTSELQSRFDLVCRLLLEKKKKATQNRAIIHSKNNEQ